MGIEQCFEETKTEDLLREYKPELVNKEILNEADLILVMDRKLMKHKLLHDVLPSGKTYVFKEFFGLQGDIEDPWPDGRDEATLAKYLRCANKANY